MNKLIKLTACLALPLSLAAYVPPTLAGNVKSSVQVSATVLDSCRVSTTPMSLDSFKGLAGVKIEATATIVPVCSLGTNYWVSVDAGLGSGASMVTRRLTGPGGATMDYAVSTDVARKIPWGDGSGGTSYTTNTGNGLPQSLPMYVTVPSSQAVQVGSYTDTITVTLAY